jgi:hypothetical protein
MGDIMTKRSPSPTEFECIEHFARHLVESSRLTSEEIIHLLSRLTAVDTRTFYRFIDHSPLQAQECTLRDLITKSVTNTTTDESEEN